MTTRQLTILFFSLCATLLCSCGGERHEVIKNKTGVLSEKEYVGMGKYTAYQAGRNEPYHLSQDADSDITNKCEYDFYFPSELKGKKLPCVIYLHEGAFVVGDKSEFIPTKISKDLTRMGYAVVNMNYRLINNPRALLSKESTRRYIMQSVGAVRLGIQDIKSKAEDLGIDTSKIYVMGWSAGAIIANTLLFTDREEALSYVAPKHRNNFQYNESFDIPLNLAGVISIGGALMADDVDDEDIKTSRCLMFHGSLDDMIPISYDNPFQRYHKGWETDISLFSPKIETENGHSYSVGVDMQIPDIIAATVIRAATTEVYGSEALLNLCDSKNMQLIEIKEGNHDFFLTGARFNDNYKMMMQRIKKFIK